MSNQNERTEAVEFWLCGAPTAEELATASNTCRRLAYMLEQMAPETAPELEAIKQAKILRDSSVFLTDWIRITAAVAKKRQS